MILCRSLYCCCSLCCSECYLRVPAVLERNKIVSSFLYFLWLFRVHSLTQLFCFSSLRSTFYLNYFLILKSASVFVDHNCKAFNFPFNHFSHFIVLFFALLFCLFYYFIPDFPNILRRVSFVFIEPLLIFLLNCILFFH